MNERRQPWPDASARRQATTNHARRKGIYLAASMAVTFAAMRAWLHWRPDADLNIGPYNIHHLFTGVLIVAACGIPAILGVGGRRLQDALTIGFGIGLSLALDQWVYLIVTDGSNAAYLLSVSLIPGAVMVAAACGYAVWLTRRTAAL